MFRLLTPVIISAAVHVSALDTRHQLGCYRFFGS